MSIRLHRTCRAAISVALAVVVSSFAGAKPPDLPTESREAVAPQADSQEIEIIEEEQEAKPIAAEQLTVMPVQAERIPFMPTEVPSNDEAECKNIVVPVNELPTGSLLFGIGVNSDAGLVSNLLDTTTAIQNLAAARRMFLIGERCRHKGDLDMAVNCYQETYLLCPACSYGRKAIARLHEVEQRRAAEAVPAEAEELEAPKPENAPSDFDTSRRPLPSVPDADVFRDLETLLNQIADAETAKLFIEAGEEQEEPPTLLVPLPPKDLTIHVDEPATYGATSSLLRQAGDMLETVTGLGIDVEFDSARSGAGLRAQGSIMLGTVGYKVTYSDSDGRATLEVVPSRP